MIYILWADWGHGKTLVGVYGTEERALQARREYVTTRADNNAYRVTVHPVTV